MLAKECSRVTMVAFFVRFLTQLINCCGLINEAQFCYVRFYVLGFLSVVNIFRVSVETELYI